jgi:ubiquinone/menaquinone biosynthesis C-methylase UbiE
MSTSIFSLSRGKKLLTASSHLFARGIRLRDLKFLRQQVATFLKNKKPEKAVREFKTNYWQTQTGAEGFVKGSDAETVSAAAVMDAVVNEYFLRHCPPRAKVLDVGSGHGVVSIFLAKNGLSVTACDISEPLLTHLAQNSAGLGIEIRQGDAHQIPAADNEFDLIVARMFLGHFPDWPDILREMTRCCRPGGKLLIHFTSKENATFGSRFGGNECEFVSSPNLSRLSVDPFTYFAEADQSEISRVCRKLGLKMLDRAPCSFFLHNRLIGHALGTKKYRSYQKEADEWLKDEKVREFVIWFEQTAFQYMPVWASHFNILVLEKSDR